MRNPRKPKFYNKLLDALKESFVGTDYEILNVLYLGCHFMGHGSPKTYRFLTLSRSTNKKNLLFWIDSFYYEKAGDYVDGAEDPIPLSVDMVKVMQLINTDTMKILYDK